MGAQLALMLLIFGVFWFVMIRPQVKRQREHQTLLNNLQKGDMIITRGGLVGKISGITENVLTVELQEKVRVRVIRSHVEGKYDPAQAKAGREPAAKAA